MFLLFARTLLVVQLIPPQGWTRLADWQESVESPVAYEHGRVRSGSDPDRLMLPSEEPDLNQPERQGNPAAAASLAALLASMLF